MEISRRIQIETVDRSSGEIVPIMAQYYSSSKYYIIKTLNAKVGIMELFEAAEIICSSSLDIRILKTMLYEADKDNRLFINITKMSKSLNISRVKLTRFMKKSK